MSGEKTEVKEILSTIGTSKICSDYDSDCKDVKCPVKCFLPKREIRGGTVYVKDIADGLCPLIHNSN